MTAFRMESILGGAAAIALAALLLPQTSSGTPGSFQETDPGYSTYIEVEGQVAMPLPDVTPPQSLSGPTSVNADSGGVCSTNLGPDGPCSTPTGPCSTAPLGPGGCSVMGTTGDMCSVEPATGGPCSVDAAGGPCSVGPDGGPCSVNAPAGGQCSVSSLGGPCSVSDPAGGPCSVETSGGPCSVNPATGGPCSVDPTVGGRCSVGQANGGPCSVSDPTGGPCSVETSGGPCSIDFATGSRCSVIRVGDTGGDSPHCSVVGFPTVGGGQCSAGGFSQPKFCSALCDDGSTCSVAPAETAAQGQFYCSTSNGSDQYRSSACSVFPFPGSGNGESVCSTGASNSTCSAQGGGNVQICSAFQGPRPQYRNFCSTLAGNIDLQGPGPACSVLTDGLPRKGACSTFIKSDGRKFCSSAGEYGSCSVLQIGDDHYTGKCTALQWAEVQSCSTFVPPGRPTSTSGLYCSVLNTTQGNNGRPGSCGRATNDPDCIGCAD